jgi:hypothetical protein
VPAAISPKKYLKINPIYFSPTENLSKIWNFLPNNGKGGGGGQNERVWNCELFFANSECEAAALSIEENVPFNLAIKLQ